MKRKFQDADAQTVGVGSEEKEDACDDSSRESTRKPLYFYHRLAGFTGEKPFGVLLLGAHTSSWFRKPVFQSPT